MKGIVQPRGAWGCAAVMALLCGWGAQGADVSAGSARLMYHGRWDRRQVERAVTVNTGSQVVAYFTGRRCVLRFDTGLYKREPATVWVQVDDGEWMEFDITDRVDVSRRVSGREVHKVWMVVKGFREWEKRWEEPLESAVVFRGLELDEGAQVVAAPAAKERAWKIEFLGDSITEGVLALGVGPREQWPHLSDGRRGYAFQTGLALGADFRVVGFGRHGITVAANGGVPPARQSFPYVYAVVKKDDWKPDAVVVNLGTNDGRVASAKFGPEYLAYIKLIRSDYPMSHIFCVRPFNGAHAADIAGAVKSLGGGGDPRVHYVDTAGWIDPAKHTTDRVHPNVEGHRVAAEKLAPIIRAELEAGAGGP